MRRPNVLLLFLLIFSLSAPLYAQTIDTAIVGTVSDNSGAVIPGANVVVLSVATGIEKKAVTAGTGEYGITYLAPGKYDLTVSAPGFYRSSRRELCCRLTSRPGSILR